MRVRFTAVVFVPAAPPFPPSRLAQPGRGGRGNGSDGKADKYVPTNDLPNYPAAVELQKFNPVAMLIDQRSKTALTDSARSHRAAPFLQSKIYERNWRSPRALRFGPADLQTAECEQRVESELDSIRTRSLQQTLVKNAVFDTLMTRREADDSDALAMITDDKQKKKAADLLDKQDASFAKLMPAGTVHRSGRHAGLTNRCGMPDADARCGRIRCALLRHRASESGIPHHAAVSALAPSTNPIPRRDAIVTVAPAPESFFLSRVTFTSTTFVPGSNVMSITFSSSSVRATTSPACRRKCSRIDSSRGERWSGAPATRTVRVRRFSTRFPTLSCSVRFAPPRRTSARMRALNTSKSIGFVR